MIELDEIDFQGDQIVWSKQWLDELLFCDWIGRLNKLFLDTGRIISSFDIRAWRK